MLRPLLSRKKVCSPNSRLSCGTTGWVSGMAWASYWFRVRSMRVELSFITLSLAMDAYATGGLGRYLPKPGQRHVPGAVPGGTTEGRRKNCRAAGRAAQPYDGVG